MKKWRIVLFNDDVIHITADNALKCIESFLLVYPLYSAKDIAQIGLKPISYA